jgi:antitoxin HicB
MTTHNYPVRLFPYDGDWIAEYPDLPGCTGVGDTPEEALASGEISKELWLEDYYEKHKAYPVSKKTFSKKYSGKFVLRITPDLHRELAIEAEEQGVSLNNLCMTYLARNNHKQN